jgi:hypothetical protein
MAQFEDGWFGSPTTLIEMTLGDILLATLRVLHVLAPGEVPTAAELADAVQAYAMMMAEWSSSGYTIYSPYSEDFPLVANLQSYRIGAGAVAPDFDTVRPSGVHDNAYVRDDEGVDSPVKLIGPDQWNDIAYKATNGQPYWWMYRPDYPYGTIFLYPTPDKPYDFFFTSEKELVYITDTTTTISLPGYYLNAIKFNLALNIAPEYEKEPSALVQRRAKETMAVVERRNADSQLEAARLGVLSGRFYSDYDVNSDTFR